MKKIISLLLFIIIVLGTYFTYDLYNKSNNLKKDITSLEETIINSQKEYNDKKQELENLKEEKKDKIQRYEDIKVWNKEVVDYLN